MLSTTTTATTPMNNDSTRQRHPSSSSTAPPLTRINSSSNGAPIKEQRLHPHLLSAYMRKHYSVAECLGVGGSGVVWRARRKPATILGLTTSPDNDSQVSDTEYAIKVMPRALIPASRFVADVNTENHEDSHVLIPMETYILRRLVHRNIIKFIEYTHDSEHVFIVTEYWRSLNNHAHGTVEHNSVIDLFTYIEHNGALKPLPRVLTVFKQLVDACLYLKSMNVWHMDLKDENVLIDTQTWQIKLVDFGSSNIIVPPVKKKAGTKASVKDNTQKQSSRDDTSTSDGTAETVFFGTLEYAPPEIRIHHIPYNVEKVEIWGLGVLLHTLNHGFPPPRNIQDLISTVPDNATPEAEWVRVLFRGCLEQDPKRRWSLERVRSFVSSLNDDGSLLNRQF